MNKWVYCPPIYKVFSALLLQDEKTKQKLFIYKFYEKLKWAYECMVEKVISDSLSEPQQHGFPNDFFDANEWFKEILVEIEKKEKYLTVENFNVIRTFILQTGKYPFNYPLSSIEKKQFYRLKFDDIYLYTNKDENNIIITSKNYKISLIRNLDEKKLFFDIPLPIAYPKEYHREHKVKLNIWFKEILEEIPQGDGFITKTETIKIAKEFLKKQEYANQYKIDTARATDTGKPYWNVWFETVKRDVMPNHGVIEVNKKTGKAKWDYLE